MLHAEHSGGHSSEDESVEDYRSRPVPALNLPQNGHFVRHQTAQQIGQQQPLGVPSAAMRHRSDTHVNVTGQTQAFPVFHSQQQQSVHQSPSSAGSRMYQAASPAGATMGGSIGNRATSPYRRAGPGKGSGASQADTRASVLAGRAVRYPDSPRQGSSPVIPMEKSSALRHSCPAGAGNTSPWHENGPGQASGGGDGRSGAFDSDTDALAISMWTLFDRWRMVSEEAASPHVYGSPQLRMDFRAIQATLNGVTNPLERLAVFETFMVMFGKHGLGDVTNSRYEDGGEYESGGGLRRHPTDLSSEDDAGWSPAYEPNRNKSDLARRRDVSDLLTKWMRKYSVGSHGAGVVGSRVSRENSTEEPFGGSEDGFAAGEMAELQRLMRHHQGTRDDSMLAEEFDEKLMKNGDAGDAVHDSPSFSSLTGSPAPPDAGANPPNVRQVSGEASFGVPVTRWGGSVNNANAGGAGAGTLSNRTSRAVSHADYASEPSSGVFSASAPRLGDSMTPAAPATVTGVAPAPAAPRRGNRKPEMAASMGLDDVEYYGSDRRGVAKMKSMLTQMKARNPRDLETSTSFQSSQEPGTIIKILTSIVLYMGGQVQVKKETKRKLRCSLPMDAGARLHAGIELTVAENGFTTVSFKRSRHDRGRTDPMAFNNFFRTVREQFIAEVQAKGPAHQRRVPQSSQKTRLMGMKLQDSKAGSSQFDDNLHAKGSMAGDLEAPSSLGSPALSPSSWARTPAATQGRGIDSRLAPRAASDMR